MGGGAEAEGGGRGEAGAGRWRRRYFSGLKGPEVTWFQVDLRANDGAARTGEGAEKRAKVQCPPPPPPPPPLPPVLTGHVSSLLPY